MLHRFWAPATHRQLAAVWLWLCGFGFVVGMALALLIRAELAYPGVQLVAPSIYNVIVSTHGMLLPVFAMTPLAIVALPLLTIMGSGTHRAHQPNVLSTLAFRLFVLAILLLILGFAAQFLQPAEDANAGWVVDPAQQVDSSLSAAVSVLMLGFAVAHVSTALAALALAWTIGAGRKAQVFRSPACIAFLVATVVSILAIAGELFELLLKFFPALAIGQSEVMADGAGPAALTSALAMTPMAIAMMLAALAILHSAVEAVSGRNLIAASVAVVATLAFVVACLLQSTALPVIVTVGVQQQAWSIGIVILLAMGVLWILTLVKARPFAWPVALGIIGFVGAIACATVIFSGQSVDVTLHDTYYVVALHHAWGQVAFVFVVYAALYASFPTLWRGRVGTLIACVQLALFAIGSVLTFAPQFLLGLQGMPRRYVDYPEVFAYWNYLSSVGSLITAGSFLLFAITVWIRRQAQ